MRIPLLIAIPLLLATAPPGERRPVIDDGAPKPVNLINCASSYQRPCQCTSAASSVPPATCEWGETCMAGPSFNGCTKGAAKDDTKK